jgi:hypothetical protein
VSWSSRRSRRGAIAAVPRWGIGQGAMHLPDQTPHRDGVESQQLADLRDRQSLRREPDEGAVAGIQQLRRSSWSRREGWRWHGTSRSWREWRPSRRLGRRGSLLGPSGRRDQANQRLGLSSSWGPTLASLNGRLSWGHPPNVPGPWQDTAGSMLPPPRTVCLAYDGSAQPVHFR